MQCPAGTTPQLESTTYEDIAEYGQKHWFHLTPNAA